MNNKKKLLILVDWFAPGYKAGGPIQSCTNLCSALNTRYDIYVLTTDTDHGETKPYPGIEPGIWLYNKELNINVCYLRKQALSVKGIAININSLSPDILYLNHLFSPFFVVYPLWLAWQNKIKCKVVVCPRGALFKSALSLKSYKKKPLLFLYRLLGIHKRITFHATNEKEKAAVKKFFPNSKIIVADNLPNNLQPAFKSIIKKPGELHCIFIARIVPIKNLLFLLKELPKVKGYVTLTITGPVEDEKYWRQCSGFISSLPEKISVVYTGPALNSELPALIQKNHLFVLPTTGENFGHSIFEAMLCGRPVLISDQTPWLDLQKEKAGWDLPLNQQNNFAGILTKLAAAEQEEFDGYAKGAWKYANNFIRNQKPIQQYITLFS